MTRRSSTIKNFLVAVVGFLCVCAPGFNFTPVEFQWRGTLWAASLSGGSFRIDDSPQVKFDGQTAAELIDPMFAAYWKQVEEADLNVCNPLPTPHQREEFKRLFPIIGTIQKNSAGIANLQTQALVNLDHTVVTRIAAAGCLVWLLLAFIDYARMRRAEGFGLCPVCRYDLRATPHRCPECGYVPTHTALAH